MPTDPYRLTFTASPTAPPEVVLLALQELTTHVRDLLGTENPQDIRYNEVSLWAPEEWKIYQAPPSDPAGFDIPQGAYFVVGFWGMSVPTSGYGEYVLWGPDGHLYTEDLLEDSFTPARLANPTTTI